MKNFVNYGHKFFYKIDTRQIREDNLLLRKDLQAYQVTMDRRRKYSNRTASMEQHVFVIFIDYRGRHRKGVAI
jgi:hypothetical protein